MVCEELKIQSQNDTVKLAEAKKAVYLKVWAETVAIIPVHHTAVCIQQ